VRVTILPRTALTNPSYFNDGRNDRESGGLGPNGNRLFDRWGSYFGDSPAAAANQELRRMQAAGGRAGDIGIEAFDPMNQVVLQEEFQRSVNGDGSPCIPLSDAESADDIVSTDSAVAGGDDLEDATTVWRQSGIAVRAVLFRLSHHHGDTSLVIVITFRENRFGRGHLVPRDSRLLKASNDMK
jgi:hypothetical protein